MRRSVVLAAIQQAQGASPSGSSDLDHISTPVASKPKPLSDASRTANGAGFGPLLGRKPFKTPTFANKRNEDGESGRKRKRISYKGMDGDGGQDGSDAGEGSDSDDGGKSSSRKRSKNAKTLEGVYKGIDANGVSLNIDRRKWNVFEVKPDAIKKGFSVPAMRNKQGQVVEVRMSNAALGVRRQPEIPPRPLHDPMAEHALVLFDPTVDDREAEREKDEMQKKLAEEEQKIEEGVRGPHKSLADILGLNKVKKKVVEKVPVVLDPRLAKILRPHQVEGVKVSILAASVTASELYADSLLFSSCIDVRPA